jgi:hypothetical protein
MYIVCPIIHIFPDHQCKKEHQQYTSTIPYGALRVDSCIDSIRSPDSHKSSEITWSLSDEKVWKDDYDLIRCIQLNNKTQIDTNRYRVERYKYKHEIYLSTVVQCLPYQCVQISNHQSKYSQIWGFVLQSYIYCHTRWGLIRQLCILEVLLSPTKLTSTSDDIFSFWCGKLTYIMNIDCLNTLMKCSQPENIKAFKAV